MACTACIIRHTFANTDNHVRAFRKHGADEFRCVFRRIGAIAVGHNIDVGFNVGEHAAHNIAFALAWLAHNFSAGRPSQVERYDLPGTASINFLLHDVLGGGGMASLRTHNLAKCYAQVLLGMAVPVPDDWVL